MSNENMDSMDNNKNGNSEVPTYDMNSEYSPSYDTIADLQQMAEESVDDETIIQQEPQFSKPKDNSNKSFLLIIAILLIILFGGIGFLFAEELNISSYLSSITGVFNKNNNNNNKQEISNLPSEDNSQDEDLSGMVDAGNIDRGDNLNIDAPPVDGADQLPGQMSEQKKGDIALERNRQLMEQQQQDVPTLSRKSVGGVGRVNPFSPSGEDLFDVMAPPTNITPDVEAASLLALKITGIMYTPDSPSAIVNIGGADQLVRSGDIINGFRINKITKDKVTVSHGKNVYTASVGEIVNESSLGINSVPNMNRKFAGPYSKGGRVIEINAIN